MNIAMNTMRTSSVPHAGLVAFMLLWFSQSNCPAQDDRGIVQHPRLAQRFGFGLSGTYTAMHLANIGVLPPDELELRAPGWCVSGTYHFKPHLTGRVSYTRSAWVVREREEWVEHMVFLPDFTWTRQIRFGTTVEEHWRFDDVRVDVLYRPGRGERGKAGLYLIGGLSVRNMILEERSDSRYDPVHMGRDLFGPGGWSCFVVLQAGAGYDRDIGPVRAFAEIASMTSSQPFIFGGTNEGLSFRWCVAAGLWFALHSEAR